MDEKIRVAILDDHQGVIDGYRYRLQGATDIEVAATLLYGEALEPLLCHQHVDVLLLDISVPTSPDNPNPYPVLHLIPKYLQIAPNLAILVISMHAQRTLIHALMQAGVNGYLLKDDAASIRELASVIRTISAGGVYLSPVAYQLWSKNLPGESEQPLSARQMEVLSLCATYPEATTADLARIMNVANSTARNLLSGVYLKLNVRNRSAAVVKARQLGLITPDDQPPIP